MENNGTEMTGGIPREIEVNLHAALLEHLTRLSEAEPDMEFDPKGRTAFVLVSLNHPTADRMPDNAEGIDRQTAVFASSLLLCPAVNADAEGNVKPGAVLSEGVHAVAANMLADILRRHVINGILPHAQQQILEWRSGHDD